MRMIYALIKVKMLTAMYRKLKIYEIENLDAKYSETVTLIFDEIERIIKKVVR